MTCQVVGFTKGPFPVFKIQVNWCTVTLETMDQLKLTLVTQTILEINSLNASAQSSPNLCTNANHLKFFSDQVTSIQISNCSFTNLVILMTSLLQLLVLWHFVSMSRTPWEGSPATQPGLHLTKEYALLLLCLQQSGDRLVK